jgi:hypothetical protein
VGGGALRRMLGTRTHVGERMSREWVLPASSRGSLPPRTNPPPNRPRAKAEDKRRHERRGSPQRMALEVGTPAGVVDREVAARAGVVERAASVETGVDGQKLAASRKQGGHAGRAPAYLLPDSRSAERMRAIAPARSRATS